MYFEYVVFEVNCIFIEMSTSTNMYFKIYNGAQKCIANTFHTNIINVKNNSDHTYRLLW